MSRTTYVIVIIMILLSAGIVWIYYTTPITSQIPIKPFERNTALHAVNESNFVKVFYVLLGDNGENGKAIGCGDSIIGINREIPATTTPLAAALKLLLTDKQRISTSTEGELTNVLYKSNLKIDSISIDEGVADIRLKGTMQLSGVCDNPRFAAQLLETAMQFQSVTKAEIFINGKSLMDALSLK